MSRMVGTRGVGLLVMTVMAGCSWPSLPTLDRPTEAETTIPAPIAAVEAESETTDVVSADLRAVNAQLHARAPRLPPREADTAEPACRPSLDAEGHLVVAEQTQSLRFERDQHHRLPRLAVWRYRSDAVLVADKPRWRVNQGARPGGTLWLVRCDGSDPPLPLHTRARADFGNAALSADGGTLYFTGPTGVGALDLDTRAVTTITEAPTLDDSRCRELYGERMPTHATDVVRMLKSSGRLVIERGSPCGFEGDWTSKREVVKLDVERA